MSRRCHRAAAGNEGNRKPAVYSAAVILMRPWKTEPRSRFCSGFSVRPWSGSKRTVPFVVQMLARVANRQNELFAEVELASLSLGFLACCSGRKRIRMGQVMESFGSIVLNRQIGQGLARHHRQLHGDLRDAWLVQGILNKFADEPALSLFLGLPAKARLIH